MLVSYFSIHGNRKIQKVQKFQCWTNVKTLEAKTCSTQMKISSLENSLKPTLPFPSHTIAHFIQPIYALSLRKTVFISKIILKCSPITPLEAERGQFDASYKRREQGTSVQDQLLLKKFGTMRTRIENFQNFRTTSGRLRTNSDRLVLA